MNVDELFKEFWRLSLTTAIPNMEIYAQRWYCLSVWFELAGYVATADNCRTRWHHYMPQAQEAPGRIAYRRVFDPPFATLEAING